MSLSRASRYLITSALIAFSNGALPSASPTTPLPAVEEFGNFYEVNLPVTGQPGDLIRIEEIQPLAPNSRAWRVLYVSTAASGELVPVSGLVAAPIDAASDEKRDIVAWAHGTKGINNACAPSRGFRISHNFFDAAPEILAEGWVAVATDYEGLGTPGVHPYLVSASEAYGQADIVRAAQKIPELNAGKRYAAWGRSQGGHATLALGERAGQYAPELNLVGIISAAPVGDMPFVFYGSAWQDSAFNWLVAAGLRAAWDSDIAKYYDTEALAELDALIEGDEACYYEFSEIVDARGDVGLKFSALWGLYGDLERSTITGEGIDVPVLLSQGTADKIVPKYSTDSLVETMCENGVQVDYMENPDESHNDSTFLHMPRFIEWTHDRLAGKPASGCQP